MIAELRYKIGLAFATFQQQARAEKAYFANFWFNLLSKVTYNIMLLLFIDQLFKRVGAVGNYSYNDFLFMFFVAQAGFYVSYYVLFTAASQIVTTVRTGNFDLLLLKPVQHRVQLYMSSIQPHDLLFTAVPGILIIASQIVWSDLSVSPLSLTLGALVWLSGLIICNTLLLALTLPAFKTGDASSMLDVFYSITSVSQMPFTKLPLAMQGLALCLLPQIIISGAASEVIMQKTDAWLICTPVFIACAISLIIYRALWRYALKNYSSASS